MTLSRALAIAWVCLCASLAAAPASADSAAQTAPSTAAVHAIAQRLDRIAANGHAASKASIARLESQLPAGSAFGRWLRGALAAIQKEKGAKQAHGLRALSSAVQRLALATQAAPPASDPHAAAARVLAQPRYRLSGGGAAPAPKPGFWDWLVSKLGELLARIIEGLVSVGSRAPIVGQIVAILLVALFAAGIAYLAIRVGRLFFVRRKARTTGDGVALPARIDPDELYARARAAAGEGAYTRAVALLFQASLAFFDRTGAVAFDPSLTPGEYRRAVRRSVAAASQPFDSLAFAFVMAAYAEIPTSHDDFGAADAAYASIRAAVPA